MLPRLGETTARTILGSLNVVFFASQKSHFQFSKREYPSARYLLYIRHKPQGGLSTTFRCSSKTNSSSMASISDWLPSTRPLSQPEISACLGQIISSLTAQIYWHKNRGLEKFPDRVNSTCKGFHTHQSCKGPDKSLIN